MLVCGNDAISPNECDVTPPPDIYTIPLITVQYDITSDVSEPSQGPSHTYNNNYLPENYGLIFQFHCYY